MGIPRDDIEIATIQVDEATIVLPFQFCRFDNSALVVQ